MLLSLTLLSTLLFGLFPWEDIFIVDGSKAALGQIPYQVSLQINSSHYCGGVLIDTQTIITAAHCFDKYEATKFKVVAGIVDLNQVGDTGQQSDINHALINPGYNSETFVNDIAVLKLETPFHTSPYVGSALLPNSDTTPSGYGVVSGWGRTAENAPMSKWLLDTQLIVMTEEQCQEVYGEDITNKVFCAGPLPGGNEDSCQGDSGGPVMCTENNQTVLCGIVSVGIGCGRSESPGIYTSVSQYKQWILTVP